MNNEKEKNEPKNLFYMEEENKRLKAENKRLKAENKKFNDGFLTIMSMEEGALFYFKNNNGEYKRIN